MTVLWLTAFIDRPAAEVGAAVRFWTRVTGTRLSPTRGERGQFATLVPTGPGGGDAFLRVQALLAGGGGGHLDLHVADVDAWSGRASCHLDLVCSDVAAEVALHEAWGARVMDRSADRTTLVDPTEVPYSLTRRDPATATLPG